MIPGTPITVESPNEVLDQLRGLHENLLLRAAQVEDAIKVVAAAQALLTGEPTVRRTKTGRSRRDRAIDAMRLRPDRTWRAAELAEAIGIEQEEARTVLQRMHQADEAVKVDRGAYRLAPSMQQ